MKLRRAFVLVSLLSLLSLAACGSDDHNGPAFKGSPQGIAAGSIIVANGTDADIDFVVAVPADLRIDRGVLSGAIRAPIPHAFFENERTLRVAPGENVSPGAEIEVLTGDTPERKPAVLVGVAGGPMFLAVGAGTGMGTVVGRRSFDGSLVIEAQDPKTLTLLPVDGEHVECAAGSLDRAFGFAEGDSWSSIGGGFEGTPVKAVTRDAEGCRLFTTGEDPFPGATMRVCIPDPVYPFAEDDTLHLRLDNGSIDLGSTWRFTNAAGDSMRLVHTTFFDDLVQNIESLALSGADDTSCARIAECGVEVPAKVSYSFAGTGRSAVTLGEAIADPADPSRSYVVLRALTRPVASGSCVAKDYATTDSSRGRAWLVIIDKAKPR